MEFVINSLFSSKFLHIAQEMFMIKSQETRQKRTDANKRVGDTKESFVILKVVSHRYTDNLVHLQFFFHILTVVF